MCSPTWSTSSMRASEYPKFFKSCGKLTMNSSLYPTWDDQSLAALFSTSTTSASTTGTKNPESPTGINPSANTTAPGSPSPTPPASPSKTPAIAGGVVGGIAVLAALVFLIWFLRARKQKKERLAMESNAVAELHNDSTYPELSTERTPEMHGASKAPHYQVDSQKNNASMRQGPFEVHG